MGLTPRPACFACIQTYQFRRLARLAAAKEQGSQDFGSRQPFRDEQAKFTHRWTPSGKTVIRVYPSGGGGIVSEVGSSNEART